MAAGGRHRRQPGWSPPRSWPPARRRPGAAAGHRGGVLGPALAATDPDDVVVAVAPFFHAIGLNLILPGSLRAGATLITMARFDLAGFLELVQEHRATCTVVVPPVILALASHPLVDRYDLSSLRFLGCGGAPLGADAEQRCADRLGCLVAQGYGMTEGSATFAIAPLQAPRPGSAGRLLPGTEARIVDPEGGADRGPGRTGELWLRGPQVMRGYRHHPAATAATVDTHGWLHTGDLLRLMTFVVMPVTRVLRRWLGPRHDEEPVDSGL